MTPCGQNYVTPTMIKKGQVTVGDHIKFDEDVLVIGPAAEAEPVQAPEPTPKAIPVHNTMPGTYDQARNWPQQMSPAEQQFQAEQQAAPPPGSGTFMGTWANPQIQGGMPLDYDHMTGYANMNPGSSGNSPDFTIPAHPLAPPDYDQTIDYDSAQYMNGFLRTQIGRGVLVQQLIGSGNTVDRYGFLVGVGNNYLLLQDYSNGNIMVIDFYTVKYVYIYYSPIVSPSFLENR